MKDFIALNAAASGGFNPLAIIILLVFVYIIYRSIVNFRKSDRSGKIKFGSILTLIGVVMVTISLAYNFNHSNSASDAESYKNLLLFGGLAFFISGAFALVSVLSKEK